MSDLKTLVENYFAPKPKTLTKQMLYEIFDEVMREGRAILPRKLWILCLSL